MKNKIILIAGHSAAGKSTFAHRLSQSLGIPFISKDTLREAMVEEFNQESGIPNNKGLLSTETTINIMMYFAKSFLQSGKICILEANFRPPHDEKIEELLIKYEAECLTFLFSGNLNVFWDRYMQRESERHWVHKFPGQNKDLFINGGIKAGFGDFIMGKTIRVDATDFNKINYEELFSAANQFITSCTK